MISVDSALSEATDLINARKPVPYGKYVSEMSYKDLAELIRLIRTVKLIKGVVSC